MKFVCNNCGFTADIPEQMSACPMCGSSNVSSAAENSNLTVATDDQGAESAKPQNYSRAEGPTQRVTLTEGMNIDEDKPVEKPVAKPVAKPEKKSCNACKICITLVGVLLLLAAAAAAAFFFFFK